MQMLLARWRKYRMLIEEVHSWRPTPAKEQRSKSRVAELTPNVAEGDSLSGGGVFSGDLPVDIAGITSPFFYGRRLHVRDFGAADRNRILLQLRALLDAGEIKIGPRGIDKGALIARRRLCPTLCGSNEKNSSTCPQSVVTSQTASSAKLPEFAVG